MAGYELSGSEEDGEEGKLREFGISEAEGNAIIIEARAHWYEDEEAAEGETAEGETSDDADAGDDGAGDGESEAADGAGREERDG